MFFLLIQQVILIISNWFLTFPSANPDILLIINAFEPAITSLKGFIAPVSYFIPVHDLMTFLYIIITLKIALYSTAFTIWVIRIVTLGIIK